MVNVAFQQRVPVQHCSCSILFGHFLVFHPMHTMIWLLLLRPCKDISQMYHLLWALNLLPTPISVSLVLIHGGKPLICLKTVHSTYWILPLSVETSLCQLGHVKLLPHRYQILQGYGYRGPTNTKPHGCWSRNDLRSISLIAWTKCCTVSSAQMMCSNGSCCHAIVYVQLSKFESKFWLTNSDLLYH